MKERMNSHKLLIMSLVSRNLVLVIFIYYIKPHYKTIKPDGTNIICIMYLNTSRSLQCIDKCTYSYVCANVDLNFYKFCTCNSKRDK